MNGGLKAVDIASADRWGDLDSRPDVCQRTNQQGGITMQTMYTDLGSIPPPLVNESGDISKRAVVRHYPYRQAAIAALADAGNMFPEAAQVNEWILDHYSHIITIGLTEQRPKLRVEGRPLGKVHKQSSKSSYHNRQTKKRRWKYHDRDWQR